MTSNTASRHSFKWALISIMLGGAMCYLLPWHSVLLSNGIYDILVNRTPIFYPLFSWLMAFPNGIIIVAPLTQLLGLYYFHQIIIMKLALDDKNRGLFRSSITLIFALVAAFFAAIVTLTLLNPHHYGYGPSSDIILIALLQLPMVAALCGPCLSIAQQGGLRSMMAALVAFLFITFALPAYRAYSLLAFNKQLAYMVLIHAAFTAINILFATLLRMSGISMRSTLYGVALVYILSHIVVLIVI